MSDRVAVSARLTYGYPSRRSIELTDEGGASSVERKPERDSALWPISVPVFMANNELRPMTSVLLIDYPLAVRQALRARLSLEPEIHIVGEADDAVEAVSMTQRLRPRVALVDAETPDLDVATLVRALLSLDQKPGVVVLTQHSASLKHSLRDTPAAVVGRHEKLRRLVDAIRSVTRD